VLEEVLGPGGKVVVTARAPPKPAEPVLTAAEKKAAKEAAKSRQSLGTMQLKKASPKPSPKPKLALSLS
jgi:hypothetical protein